MNETQQAQAPERTEPNRDDQAHDLADAIGRLINTAKWPGAEPGKIEAITISTAIGITLGRLMTVAHYEGYDDRHVVTLVRCCLQAAHCTGAANGFDINKVVAAGLTKGGKVR